MFNPTQLLRLKVHKCHRCSITSGLICNKIYPYLTDQTRLPLLFKSFYGEVVTRARPGWKVWIRFTIVIICSQWFSYFLLQCSIIFNSNVFDSN